MWFQKEAETKSTKCAYLLQINRNHPYEYTEWPKKFAHFLYTLISYALSSLNNDRFSNLFHCLDQENICNNTTTEDPITAQVCHYTTLWNVDVLLILSNNWKQEDFCNNTF